MGRKKTSKKKTKKTPARKIRRKKSTKKRRKKTPRQKAGSFAERFTTSFERLKKKSPFDARYWTHINNDDSVDGEYRMTMSLDADVNEVPGELLDMYVIPRWSWFALGIRLRATEIAPDRAKRYKLYWGKAAIQTRYYYYSKKRDFAFLALEDIIEKMGDAGHGVVDEIFIRVHWNPEGVRPEKRYT